MTRFSDEFKQSMRGDGSFESAIVDESAYQETGITPELVIQTQEERAELADALEQVDEIGDDRKDIDAAAAVTDAVVTAVAAAETMPAAASETFAEIANVTIASAAQVLDCEMPRLETDPHTGAITEESMESFSSWFSGAAKSFMEASSNFFARIGLGISRLNDSSQGLTKRCMRVRTVMGDRKGNGGKPIKLSSGVQRHLVLGDGYAADPIAALTEFGGFNVALTKVVNEYHKRLGDLIKDRIFAAVSSGQKNDIFVDLQSSDLLDDIEKILARQPKNLLGNQVYAFNDRPINKVLKVTLQSGMPNAIDLIRHLDAPNSLSNEAIVPMLTALEGLIAEQLMALEKMSSQSKASFKSLQDVIKKFNGMAEEAEIAQLKANGVEAPVSLNSMELLRVENQLVSELGRVCDRLVDYQRDMIDRIDSLLTLVEESVFQD